MPSYGRLESVLAPDFYGRQTQVTTFDKFFPIFSVYTEKDLYTLQAQCEWA